MNQSGQLFRTLCDLLFITIAILVLLFVVVITQAKQSQSESQASAEATELAQDDAVIASQQANEARQAAEDLRRKNQALEAKMAKGTSIEFVAVIDVSASMSKAYEKLHTALLQLAKLVPRVTSFKIGVLAYREGTIAEFPLQEIVNSDSDGGESLRRFEQFLSQIETSNGPSGIDRAMNRGLTMLDESGGEQMRQVFGVLADVGTGEMSHHQTGDNQRMIDRVDRWSRQVGRDRRVVSLYSGGLGEGDDRTFFEGLGSLPSGVFCEETGDMLPALFEAIYLPLKE